MDQPTVGTSTDSPLEKSEPTIVHNVKMENTETIKQEESTKPMLHSDDIEDSDSESDPIDIDIDIGEEGPAVDHHIDIDKVQFRLNSS
jgi:hypothetical protein